MRVLVKKFSAVFKTWDGLFLDAIEFATALPPENLISISHSSDQGNGVVAVWYFGEPDHCVKCNYDLTGNTSGRCPECGTVI